MGKRIEVDTFLHEYSKGNKQLNDSVVPDFASIEYKVLHKQTKMLKIVTPSLRVALAVVFLVFVFGLGAFFSGSAIVRAYKQRSQSLVYSLANSQTHDGTIRNESSQIEDIQKKVPYQIATPHWLPDGMVFLNARSIDMGNGVYSVRCKYEDPTGNRIQIEMTNESNVDTAVVDNPSSEYVDVQGTQVAIDLSNKDHNIIRAYYIGKNNLFINITGNIDEQAILKLVLGLY